MAKMKTSRSLIQMGAAGIAAVLFTSCGGPTSGVGFSLPDGDGDRGREAFVRLTCTECHTIAGETLPSAPKGSSMEVPLGGEVVRVKTYGQLVTSIINPQHIVSAQYQGVFTDAEGRSMMRDYNDEMTISEMIDIVAFLQAHYKLKPPDPAYYPYP